MKFFTLEWWSGDVESDQDPVAAYNAYYNEIKETLPKDFVTVHNEISLHDGHISNVHISNNEMRIRLNCENGSGETITVELRYTGLISFNTYANFEKGLPGPYGYGDWGYDEIYVDDKNTYEHRIIFSSGIEYQINFTDFKISIA